MKHGNAGIVGAASGTPRQSGGEEVEPKGVPTMVELQSRFENMQLFLVRSTLKT